MFPFIDFISDAFDWAKTEIGNRVKAEIVIITHAARITLSFKIVFVNFGFNIITHLLLGFKNTKITEKQKMTTCLEVNGNNHIEGGPGNDVIIGFLD